MTHFINISGKARAGKDVTGKLLKSNLESRGYKVLLTHYADLLKFMCKQYFGWNGDKDEAGRTLLQHVGTDCIRASNPTYWVDFIVELIKLFPDKWDYVIIADTRFPNELERIAEFGFTYTHIEVVREGFENDLTDEQKMHPSETALEDTLPEIILYNNDTIETLSQSVDTCCRYLLGETEEYEVCE